MAGSIVVLTGAGISAESGLKTFRASDGLWENHRIEEVATPEAFRNNPKLVHEFYNLRRRQLRDPQTKPNLAHQALAELEQQWPGDFLLVTQNVDNLHERAGSQKILHMHGELTKIRCLVCDLISHWEKDLDQKSECPSCGRTGTSRPHIVWFGESPFYMDEIYSRLQSCAYFISIGTSGLVYPAANFVTYAKMAKKIEINIEKSVVAPAFDEHLTGSATVMVPKIKEKLLSTLKQL